MTWRVLYWVFRRYRLHTVRFRFFAAQHTPGFTHDQCQYHDCDCNRSGERPRYPALGDGLFYRRDARDKNKGRRQHAEPGPENVRAKGDAGQAETVVKKIERKDGDETRQGDNNVAMLGREPVEALKSLIAFQRCHGRVTCEPPNIRAILDHADCDNVYACWNSNAQDVVDGSIDANFELLRPDIGLVHITELWNDYPWPRLFELLAAAGYEGFCLAEIPASADPVRLMRYYRALWLAQLSG